MLVRIVVGTLAAALAVTAMRKVMEMQERAKVKVRTDDRITRLRRDPETGIYRPEA